MPVDHTAQASVSVKPASQLAQPGLLRRPFLNKHKPVNLRDGTCPGDDVERHFPLLRGMLRFGKAIGPIPHSFIRPVAEL